MGDATNTVLIFGGELLKKAENLLVMGLHPSEIIKGYELACTKAVSELESAHADSRSRSFDLKIDADLTMFSLPSPLTQSTLSSALKPAIASKQYGHEDLLSSLVAEAALAIMPPNPKNFNVDNVRVVKIMGGSLSGSKVVQGMVFGREPEGSSLSCALYSIPDWEIIGMIKKVTKAKVAVFTSALDVAQTETKGTVLIKNADDMLNFTTGEEKHIEKVCVV
jgi:chaperonin GroEL (HSP60 family)